MAAVPSVRSLIADSWRLYRAYWLRFVLVVGVIAIPTSIINTTLLASPADGDTSAATLSAYIAMLTVAMLVALAWTVLRSEAGRSATIRQAYFFGTAGFVKYIIVSLLIFLELLPFLLGALVFAGGLASGASLVEGILYGTIWLLLALPSAALVPRHVFALFSAGAGRLTPGAALSLSNLAVRGRTWRVLGRLIAAVLLLIISIAVPTFALLLLLKTMQSLSLLLVSIVTSLTLLPLFYIYLAKLGLGIGAIQKAD